VTTLRSEPSLTDHAAEDAQAREDGIEHLRRSLQLGDGPEALQAIHDLLVDKIVACPPGLPYATVRSLAGDIARSLAHRCYDWHVAQSAERAAEALMDERG